MDPVKAGGGTVARGFPRGVPIPAHSLGAAMADVAFVAAALAVLALVAALTRAASRL